MGIPANVDFRIRVDRNALIVNAVNATGVEYVSLDGTAGSSGYCCGTGIVVYGYDRQGHVTEHRGFARHPNDREMQAATGRIIDTRLYRSRPPA